METTKISLNSGELSDELFGRIDLQKVQMGCETAENVRILRAGGMTRRAGFLHSYPTIDQDKLSRLQGFNFINDNFVLEFGDYNMRVFHQGGCLLDVGDNPYTFVTPWSSDQVFGLHFAQRGDTIVVTHPDVEPHLVRYDSAAGNLSAWQVIPFNWQERIWQTLADAPLGTQLSVSALSGTVTVTSSESIFDSSWVGSRIRLGHVRPQTPKNVKTATFIAVGYSTLNLSGGNYLAGAIVTLSTGYSRTLGKYAGVTPVGNRQYFTLLQNYNSATNYVSGNNDPDRYPAFFMQGAVLISPVEVDDQWEFETFDTWRGIYAIERSYDGGANYSPVRVLISDNDKNFLVKDVEDPALDALYRVIVLDLASTADSRLTLTAFASSYYGYGLVTASPTATTLTVTTEKEFESTNPTMDWYEDAFNSRNGYANCGTFHQSRLFFGGTRLKPNKIWSSRIAAPYDFTFTTLPDGGLDLEVSASEFENICWMVSHSALLVGTSAGVWSITSPEGQSVTPESNAINRQVRNGSKKGFSALPLQNNVLFLQNAGRKINELASNEYGIDTYISVDLTQLASHITRNGVTQMASNQTPDATLYLVVGGELALLTYERSQNIVGWTRWVTDGEITSIGTCQGNEGAVGGYENDLVYIVVNRDGNQAIEFLSPDMMRKEEDNNVNELVFLDASKYFEFVTPSDTLTDLDYLNGREVEVFADGEPIGSYTVSAGTLTLPKEVSYATVGLPYTSTIKTMPLEQGTIGRKSNISEATIRFRNSLGGQVSQDGINWTNVVNPQGQIPNGEPMPLASGDVKLNIHSTWERKAAITIRQTQPFPLSILAIRATGQTSN